MKYKTYIKLANDLEKQELYDLLGSIKKVSKQERSIQLIEKLIETVYNSKVNETTKDKIHRSYESKGEKLERTFLPESFKEIIKEA